jgi:hypothetical protein
LSGSSCFQTVFCRVQPRRTLTTVFCCSGWMILSLENFGFTSNPFWPKIEGFMHTVEEAWNSVLGSSCPFDVLSRKLKSTARKLQKLEPQSFFIYWKLLKTLGLCPTRKHGCTIISRNIVLPSPLKRIARSRSRISWLGEGDANTALFHVHARNHRGKTLL